MTTTPVTLVEIIRLRAEIAWLRAALIQIDTLPTGHYRRNGFATPDPWVRQQDVHRIARIALAPTPNNP